MRPNKASKTVDDRTTLDNLENLQGMLPSKRYWRVYTTDCKFSFTKLKLYAYSRRTVVYRPRCRTGLSVSTSSRTETGWRGTKGWRCAYSSRPTGWCGRAKDLLDTHPSRSPASTWSTANTTARSNLYKSFVHSCKNLCVDVNTITTVKIKRRCTTTWWQWRHSVLISKVSWFSWLVGRLTSPVSTKIGYIEDKVLSGDLVLPG